ncbi:MAG: DUF4147 domain-containing protein [Deltaproteobacteria bacterium]|nr:DUF4147 domain-containing protein [Deltaproteobacteria bacterium]
MIEMVLRRAFTDALASLRLAPRVRDALGPAPPAGRVTVVAVGKSAAPMLEGLLQAWPDRADTVLVARPERSVPPSGATLARCEDFAGGHPLPARSAVRAWERLCLALEGGRPEDTVVVLLSGGASASLCAPRPGLTLRDLQRRCEALLRAGLPIEALNRARGGLDLAKHGGLLRRAAPAQVRTLASADILGDDVSVMHTLGGAPTVHFQPLPLAPEVNARIASVLGPWGWEHSLPPEPPEASQTYTILVRPSDARDTLVAKLTEGGLRVTLGGTATGAVETLAEAYLRDFKTVAPGEARVLVGEPTVTLPEGELGVGGRAGRLSLLVSRGLTGQRGVAFLAAGTDGVDGASPHAGAVVTGASWEETGADALARYDDAPWHGRRGTAVVTGPTGLNLLDLHVLARAA